MSERFAKSVGVALAMPFIPLSLFLPRSCAMASGEGTCVAPKKVEIVVYEDRDANHIMEVRSQGYRVKYTRLLEARTPLKESAETLGLLIDQVLALAEGRGA